MKGHNWGPEPCKKCGKTHRTAPVKSHTPWNKGLKNDQRVSKLTKNLGSYAQRGGSSNEQNAMFGKTGSEHPAFGYKHTSKGTKKISASLRQRVHDEFVADVVRQLRRNGMIAIPLRHDDPRPDVICVKDGKVVAVEVERKCQHRRKSLKYELDTFAGYDGLSWVMFSDVRASTIARRGLEIKNLKVAKIQ